MVGSYSIFNDHDYELDQRILKNAISNLSLSAKLNVLTDSIDVSTNKTDENTYL